MGIFGARATGQLFPVFPMAVLGAMLLLVPNIFVISELGNRIFNYLLSLLVFYAISIRMFIFTFPASMIGFDPDTFAISIQRVINTGNTAGILSGFYRDIPLFHIFTAIYSQIAMVRPAEAMAMWSVLVGVLFPISAAIFSLYLNNNFISALTASALVAVLSNSVNFSYTPIPNLMAAALFLPLIICLVKYKRRVYLIPMNLLFLAIIFTHKLHPLVTICSLLFMIILSKLDSLSSYLGDGYIFSSEKEILALFFVIGGLWSGVIYFSVPSLLTIGIFIFISIIYRIVKTDNEQIGMSHPTPHTFQQVSNRHIWNVLFLFGILLFIQWTIITNLVYSVVVYRVLPLVRQPQTVTDTQFDLLFAEPVDPGIFDIFFHQSDILLLLLPMSLGWIYFFYNRRDNTTRVLLAVSGVSLALIPFGLFAGVSGGLGAPRALLIFSPIGVALITSFVFDKPRGIIKIVFISLLVIQIFSAGFVPDYPNQYRKYLTDEEVSGKEFGNAHFNSAIYTDYFYSTESIQPVINQEPGDKQEASGINRFEHFGSDLYQKNITGGKYEIVALRTDIDVYRTIIPVQIRLNWNPERTFNEDDRYGRIYDNGGVNYYRI
jgi:hypothetical protein